MLNGLFAFIWQVPASAPDAATLVNRVREGGFKSVVIKVVDGKRSYPLKGTDEPLLQDSIAALRDAGITVWGWGAFYGKHPDPAKDRGTPEEQAQKTAERILGLNLPGFALDVENFLGTRWSPELATRFMTTLQTALAGHPVELALCSYRFPKLHGSFPLAEFAQGCSIMMPQMYWIQSQPVADLVESLKQYEVLAPGKPYLPLGIAAPSDDGSWRPTPGEIIAFMNESQARHLPAYGFWTLQHAFADKVIWQTLVDYRPGAPAADDDTDVGDESEDSAPTVMRDVEPVEPLHATGTVTANTLNYRDAPSVHSNVIGTLQNKAAVTITGRQQTDDPVNDLWYRIKLDDGTFWASADFILLDPVQIDPGSDPLLARLNNRAALAFGTQLPPEQVQALVDLLEESHLWLRGQWLKLDLDELTTYLTTLKEWGVSLDANGGTRDTGWSFDEIRLVYNAVGFMARHAYCAFLRRFGNQIQPDDMAYCFRTLYAPLKLSRVNRDNLNPNDPDGLTNQWWAINDNGYSIRFGNKVFRQTRQTIRTSAGSSPKFTPEELIMHELSHSIGFRRRISDTQWTYEYDNDLSSHSFADHTMVALTPDSGLLARARSRLVNTEVIADLFANDAHQKFTINLPGSSLFSPQEDLEGRARAEQAQAIMDKVVEFRLNHYGIEQKNNGPQPSLQYLQAHADSDTARSAALKALL